MLLRRWWHAPTATKDSDVLENGHESETEHWDTVMQFLKSALRAMTPLDGVKYLGPGWWLRKHTPLHAERAWS
eukprot:1189317-Prorocentrum_minimum.AAC.2